MEVGVARDIGVRRRDVRGFRLGPVVRLVTLSGVAAAGVVEMET